MKVAALSVTALLLQRLSFISVVASSSSRSRTSAGGYDYVDPLIGTSNGGHVFPGATLPFGMAKPVADVDGENQGGFGSDGSNIIGFSHMHDSGTGYYPSLGNFPLFPQAGCLGDDLNSCKFTKEDWATPSVEGTVEARPGYFAVSLDTSIHAEMTASNHTALYRFTFPKAFDSGESTPLSPLMTVELNDLRHTRSTGSISVDPLTGRITGEGNFQPSFGTGTYRLHFCADFSGASIRDTGTFNATHAGSEWKNLTNVKHSTYAGGYTWLNAPTTNDQILTRVGVSFISVEQACFNAEKEIPDFNFEETLEAAEIAWKNKLAVIQIDAGGVNKSLQTTFWSGIYRSMLSPQDYTGENPLWHSTEPYYDSYYCIWDSFRTTHPLLIMIDPSTQARMVRSLIDIYRHEGYLPDCRMQLCKGFTQGGSNADVVLAESFLKNITESIDWVTGYEAVIADAEDEPRNWQYEGRGSLESWKDLHYVPVDAYDPHGHRGLKTRSVSRTVEYAYNDYCIAGMAQRMGRTADYEKYMTRSQNWQHLFLADQTSSINGVNTGFTGFLQPKSMNGTWRSQDPVLCSPLSSFGCYLDNNGHETYEGSIWLYTFFVPGDMASLVAALGGPSTFTKRLDFLHTSGLLDIGDEQGFLPIFQYHYGGRPGLSAARAHYYIPSRFNDTLGGLPGNDDGGGMGSFVALAMMGLYPNAGQDVYLITPPFFKEVNITNGQTGRTATIRNLNFDPEYQNLYIQSATLDGKPYTRSWISHSFLLGGGVLELTLGWNESSWGQADADVPPSSSTSGTPRKPIIQY